MKLLCTVSVGNRLVNNSSQRKHAKSTLALCKHPKSEEYCLILFAGQDKTGAKYNLNNNINHVFTRYACEGKTTIQFKQPPHDLYIQADVIQLRGFLHLLQRAMEKKISEKELTYSSMAVTPISLKRIPPTKLCIRNRSEYPSKGFPRTLEILSINDIQRCSLDRGILNLKLLKVLDLSTNCIEFLPEELKELPCLTELNVAENQLGKASPGQWSWMGGKLSRSLKVLNLSGNSLKYLPDQIVKLYNLVNFAVDRNELTSLPPGIGNLLKLKVFSASYNCITSMPGSVKMWHLQSLDLSNNRFHANEQSNPAAIFPKPPQACSLKESSARVVLSARLSYSPENLPRTVIDYLDHAKYCVCGKACFQVYIKHHHMLLLSSVTQHLSVSLDGNVYVPMDCYFCSLKCFRTANYTRFRNPVI